MGIQAFAMKNEHKKEAHTSHVSTNNNETNKPKKKVSPKFFFKTQVPKVTTYAHTKAVARSLSPNSKAELVKELSQDLKNNPQSLPAEALVTWLAAARNITEVTTDQCQQHLRAEILDLKQHGKDKLKKPTPPRERNNNQRRSAMLNVPFPVDLPPTPPSATVGNEDQETNKLRVSIEAPTSPGSTTNGEQNHLENREVTGYEAFAHLVARGPKQHVPREKRLSSIYYDSPSATPQHKATYRSSVSISSPQNSRHSRSSSDGAKPSTQNDSGPTLDISANGINKISNGV